jgi:NTE family protein
MPGDELQRRRAATKQAPAGGQRKRDQARRPRRGSPMNTTGHPNGRGPQTARRSDALRFTAADGERGPRIGLVLGAGGVLGGAWLTGALQAIASETGWDPGSSRYIVGTSAGAMVGALIACGVPPWFMVAHAAGESFPGLHDANGDPAERPDRAAGARYRLHPGVPQLGPGSWRLALSSLARPYKHSPAALLAGWMPLGPISTEPLKDTVRRACAEQWAPHPNYWAIAVDYASGSRVAFGSAGAPSVTLADAVAASCAVPGFFRAVDLGGRRYVDGGVHSVSNLDLLAEERLDLVLVLNPMSSLHAGAPRTVGEGVAYAIRQQAGRRLRAEVSRLQDAGTKVVLIQPTVHDLDAMGTNLMSRKRRNQVIATAIETVTDHLRHSPVAELLSVLPPGIPQLVRRPSEPATQWAEFRELARARWRPTRQDLSQSRPGVASPRSA